MHPKFVAVFCLLISIVLQACVLLKSVHIVCIEFIRILVIKIFSH